MMYDVKLICFFLIFLRCFSLLKLFKCCYLNHIVFFSINKKPISFPCKLFNKINQENISSYKKNHSCILGHLYLALKCEVDNENYFNVFNNIFSSVWFDVIFINFISFFPFSFKPYYPFLIASSRQFYVHCLCFTFFNVIFVKYLFLITIFCIFCSICDVPMIFTG